MLKAIREGLPAGRIANDAVEKSRPGGTSRQYSPPRSRLSGADSEGAQLARSSPNSVPRSDCLAAATPYFRSTASCYGRTDGGIRAPNSADRQGRDGSRAQPRVRSYSQRHVEESCHTRDGRTTSAVLAYRSVECVRPSPRRPRCLGRDSVSPQANAERSVATCIVGRANAGTMARRAERLRRVSQPGRTQCRLHQDAGPPRRDPSVASRVDASLGAVRAEYRSASSGVGTDEHGAHLWRSAERRTRSCRVPISLRHRTPFRR